MATLFDQMKRWDLGAPSALDREAEDVARHGIAEPDIYDTLEQLLTARDAGVDEETEEQIHGVMDRLTGWCHAANQIQTAQNLRSARASSNGPMPNIETKPAG